jgi:uncharacterized protein (TIGR03067 family)
MKLQVLMALTVGWLVAADALKDSSAKKELQKFQGTWKVASMEIGGKKVADDKAKGATLVVKGNQYAVKMGDKTLEQGTFKIDPTKKPKTIDVTPTEGKGKGKTFHGIYQINGDEARDSFSTDNKERPTSFDTKANSKWVVRVYKRVKS